VSTDSENHGYTHYKSNVRDQVFNRLLGVDKALGQGEYAGLDVDAARQMLAEIARLVECPIAESYRPPASFLGG